MKHRTRRLVIHTTTSMTAEGLNNCMLVPFAGLDLVNPRFFPPSWGLLMVCTYSVGRHRSTQYIFSSYPTLHIHSGCSMHAFPLPYRRILLYTPSIYPSYLLFVGPGFLVSFIYILNLFFFLLFFFLSIFLNTYRDTYATVPTGVERFIFANHPTHEPLNKHHLHHFLKNILSSCDPHSHCPSRPSYYFLLSFFCRCLFFFTLFSNFSRFFFILKFRIQYSCYYR